MSISRQKLPLCFLSLIIILGSLAYAFRNTDISLKEKLTLSIILSASPVSHHFRASYKYYDNIDIEAYHFRGKFIIENFEYKASDFESILNKLKRGDTVAVWVDKIRDSDDNILVYGLRFKGVDYIDVTKRNDTKSRYNKYGLIVAFYGLFLLLYRIFEARYSVDFEKRLDNFTLNDNWNISNHQIVFSLRGR